MPSIWDNPCHPIITHTGDSHQIPSQKKTKSKLQIFKNCQKVWHFANKFTRNTPSEVAWYDVWIWNGSNQNCRHYRGDRTCRTDRRMDRRTYWWTYVHTYLSTDGWTGRVKPIHPATTSLCRGMINHTDVSHPRTLSLLMTSIAVPSLNKLM